MITPGDRYTSAAEAVPHAAATSSVPAITSMANADRFDIARFLAISNPSVAVLN
jgi:hypothetical protein